MEFKKGDLIRNKHLDVSGVVIKILKNLPVGELLEVRYDDYSINTTSVDYINLFEPDYKKIREIKINEILNGIS